MQGNIWGWATWPRCFPVQPSHKAVGMWFSQTQCLQFLTDKITKTCNSNINIIWAIFKTDESRPPLPLRKVEGRLGLSGVCDSTTNQQGIRKHVMPPTSLGFPMSRTQICDRRHLCTTQGHWFCPDTFQVGKLGSPLTLTYYVHLKVPFPLINVCYLICQ